MRLRNRAAIVTGAGSQAGIGRAIALALSREGAAIAVAGRSGVEHVVDEILGAGGRAIPLVVDVSVRAEVEMAVEQTIAEFGKLDILVNNAGFCEFRPFLEIDDQLWQRTLDVNVSGYFHFGQAAARQMVAQGNGGAIINITSISAEVSGELKTHYCVTKAADKMLTLGMALELGRHGIRVNAIAPGTIETDIVRDPVIQEQVDQTDWAGAVPLGRIGTAHDVAGAAVFLASSDAAYVTGATILVDGGALTGTLL